jgi:hypothetical protein
LAIDRLRTISCDGGSGGTLAVRHVLKIIRLLPWDADQAPNKKPLRLYRPAIAIMGKATHDLAGELFAPAADLDGHA